MATSPAENIFPIFPTAPPDTGSCSQVSPQPPLPRDEQPQLFQPFLTAEVLWGGWGQQPVLGFPVPTPRLTHPSPHRRGTAHPPVRERVNEFRDKRKQNDCESRKN